jgi:hypothetical protein
MKLRILFTTILLGYLPGGAHGAIRTVALSGQQAPGAPAGANFTQLYDSEKGPVLNNAGRVAFAAHAMTSGGAASNGIWSDVTGTLTAVTRSGVQAPGTSLGINFTMLRDPVLNDAGRTAFHATISAPAATNTGVWSEGSSDLSLVARKGSAAPGAGAGANYLTIFGTSLNDTGQEAFRAQLSGGPVTANDDVGIWAEKAGALTLMARENSQAPGAPAGILFDNFPAGPILINAAGRIAFRGFLRGPGVSMGNNRIGIWAERAGGLEMVAREGNNVPGVAGAEFAFIDDPVLNRNGQVAFVASMSFQPTATNSAVFSEAGGALAIAARRGDAAPGAGFGANFNGFSAPMLNGEGHLAFAATLTGGSVTTSNDAGIWSNSSGTLNLVAREGSSVPGLDPGVNFGTFADNVLNSAGQLAFTATLTGAGVTGANDFGIWAQGLDGNLRLVAREGQQIQVSPGVNRTIAELDFTGAANTEDGRRTGFNDLGEVAFYAGFTDGTSGIFVSDVAKAASGDFDGDGDFDGGDFLIWQRGLGRVGTGLPSNGDANGDGNVNAADLAVWKSKFGAPATMAATAVPEPRAAVLAFGLLAMAFVGRRATR